MKTYQQEQAEAVAKRVRGSWGKGWLMLSEREREAEMALAYFYVVLGWDEEKHEAAALARAFVKEMK